MRQKAIPARELYEILLRHYGPQHWWPAAHPDEMAVGAILTQNTSWKNVEKALSALRAGELTTLQRVACLPRETLASLIRPCGYYNQKSANLVAFARNVRSDFGSLEALFAQGMQASRRWLLAQRGIGPETADSILCYGAGYPALVVDSYTVRLGYRLGWWREQTVGKRYGTFQETLLSQLPARGEQLGEFHALIVTHGKERCSKRTPACSGCPLDPWCLRERRSG
ncbi:MAG: hypothetical protein K9L28_05585 [Synergistales bacterium]|nr:hypothetical protein [Synergistales bacterium]